MGHRLVNLEPMQPHPPKSRGASKNEPTKKINTRIRLHHAIVMYGIPLRYQFLFNKDPHSIISCLVRQRLFWIAAVSSVRPCARIHQYAKSQQHDIYLQLPYLITDNRLILCITITELSPPLCTNRETSRIRIILL